MKPGVVYRVVFVAYVMAILASTVALALTLGRPVTGQASQLNIEGEYACTGTDDGTPYVTELLIEAFGDTFRLSWRPAAGHEPNLIGLGVLFGDALGVAMVHPASGAIGAVVYRVTAEGLTGAWTGGTGSVATETCTPRTLPGGLKA